MVQLVDCICLTAAVRIYSSSKLRIQIDDEVLSGVRFTCDDCNPNCGLTMLQRLASAMELGWQSIQSLLHLHLQCSHHLLVSMNGTFMDG
jgi:hypothetical protein